MTSPVLPTAPESPAASANGTVSPSDIPITTSRTLSLAVKCRSRCGVCGMTSSVLPELPEMLSGAHHRGRLRNDNDTDRAIGFEYGQPDLLSGPDAMLAHCHLQL